MKILIEISEEAAAALEVLAEKERRSKTAQAAKIVEDTVLFVLVIDTVNPEGAN